MLCDVTQQRPTCSRRKRDVTWCDVPLQIHYMPLHAALCGTRRDMCLEICSAHVKRRGQTMCKKSLEERVSCEETKRTSPDILLEETK